MALCAGASTVFMGWSTQRSPASEDVVEPKTASRRRAMVVLLTVLAHVGAVAGWLAACAPRPEPPLPPPWARPRIHLAVLHGVPPEAPRDAPVAPAPRFDALAVNPAHPDVLLAWNDEELAYSRDDGRTFIGVRLPRTAVPRTIAGRSGVVTSSGAALVDLDRDTWVRNDGVTTNAVPSPLAGEVRAWASDARRVVAVVAADDGSERFYVSTDDGETWKEGPQPEREVYDLAIRPDGRVIASWAWSASCGGGGEGHSKWSTGDASWEVASRAPIAPLCADDWIYGAEYDDAGKARFITGWGPGDRVARGPAVLGDEAPWTATDGRSTYIVTGTTVLSAHEGTFTKVDDHAPAGLRGVEVDGRGRIVGVTGAGISRRTTGGVWEQLFATRPVVR